MTQLIENTSFRTTQFVMSDGQLTTIPWPDRFVAGTVFVNANNATIGGLMHARSGGNPIILQLATPLANLTITSTDLTAAPPASGTGKITVGRSTAGFQLHAGLAATVAVTFLG